MNQLGRKTRTKRILVWDDHSQKEKNVAVVEGRRSPKSGLGIEEGRMMRQTTYRRCLSKLSVKSVVL